MKLKFALLATAAAALPAVPATARHAVNLAAVTDTGAAIGDTDSAPPRNGDAKKAHLDSDQAIVVTGVRRAAGDLLGSVSVLDREQLLHDTRPSIGETLQSQPGVSASSFGPTASRPILRGLQGERVRVLVDGIGSLDLSSSDPDHAVPINPLTAERIEVLRGPSALLFGSSAIGGVVNVIDTRIPRAAPDKPVSVDAVLNYGSAANERSANLSVNIPLGGHFVAHADGAYSKFDDLHVGGHLLSPDLRARAFASPNPEIQELADLKDNLPNTGGRLADTSGGLAYVDGDLNIGLSVTHHSFRYGVPIRFSLNAEVHAEQPTLVGRQTRADTRVNIPLGDGFFKIFEFRGGIGKYHHDELEKNGAVGSSFRTRAGEMRADVVQNERSGWGGTSGAQFSRQRVFLSGDEKYLPDSTNRQFGLFTLQWLVLGKVRIEGGARIEFAKLRADEDETITEHGEEVGAISDIGAEPLARSFTPMSASFGANYEFAAGWRAGLSLSHNERAPSIDELFSLGPHGGSQQFLIGNPDLEKETSNGIELSVHRTAGPVHVQGSIYYSRFNNFIYLAPTAGTDPDGLPIYDYQQGKAKYYGFELGSDAKLGNALGIDWGAEVVADTVRATIKNFGPAPQIPPLRLLGALTGARGQVGGRLEVERVSAQHHVAPNETDTTGYTLVNASLDYHPFAANPELTLSLQGNNLFDAVARRHSSFLKDYAPLAGRDVRLSARVSF